MKKLCAFLALGAMLAACEPQAGGGKAEMKTSMDSVSFAIGLNIGKSIRQDSIAVNPDLIAGGIKAAMANDSTAMPDSVIQQVMMNFQMEMMKKQSERQAKVGENNKKAGEEFLAKNKTASGVQTTASGLQYQVVTEGAGATPTDADEITVNYHGTLLDGEVFDSSRDRGQPLTIKMAEVVPGWREALKLMKEGGKIIAWIPSDLAYGPAGSPPRVGPNATLKFEIELIKVGAAK